MQHDFPQHEGHDASRASADHVFHVGKIFLQHAAFVVFNFRDVAWHDANAVIRENAEGGSLLEQGNFGRAQCHGQVGRDIGSNPEAMRVVDHSPYSDTVRELERRNVARLRERPPQSYRAFKLLIIIVGRVRAGCGLESDRRIEDGVVRSCSLIDGSSIDVRFERRSDLP